MQDYRLKTKQLCYGGRVMFVKHVLQSLNIHFLSAARPPSNVRKNI